MNLIKRYKIFAGTFGKHQALTLSIQELVQRKRPVTPVFIVGCGHSGTSLVNKILSTHESIWAIGGESGIFKYAKNSTDAEAHIRYWTLATRRSGKSHFLEKTPGHVQFISEIKHQYPSAKIIGVTRNPVDTIASLYQRNNSLAESIKRYKEDNLQLIKHRNEIHIIALESIIDEFDTTFQMTQDFISVPQRNLSEYHKVKTFFDAKEIRQPHSHSGNEHRIKRNFQVNQPLFDTRGSWKNILNPHQAAEVEQELQPVANQIGY